jgi:hypothetical protein
VTIHKQIHIQYGDNEAEVDEDIAPIILECWKNDIETVMSCQNNVPQGFVWICFMSFFDASKFMNLVANKYQKNPKSIYNRVLGNWVDDSIERKLWRYSTNPIDLNLSQTPDEDDVYLNETHEGDPDFIFDCSIRFPCTDMKKVLSQLKKASKKINLRSCIVD